MAKDKNASVVVSPQSIHDYWRYRMVQAGWQRSFQPNDIVNPVNKTHPYLNDYDELVKAGTSVEMITAEHERPEYFVRAGLVGKPIQLEFVP